MEAILKFNLEDLDDRLEHLRAVKATDMALVLWEVVYNSRKYFENQIEEGKFTDQQDLLDAVYKHIWAILEARDVNPDNLIH